MELFVKSYDSEGNEMEIPKDSRIICSADGTFYIPFFQEEKEIKCEFCDRPERLNPETPKGDVIV